MLSAGLPPGSVVAGFKIIGELGRGSNGVVYRALQVSLNREVALKILADEKTGDAEFIDNFFKEVRAAARLNHQHIVQAFDAGTTADGIYYFAMELADGDTLDKYISEHGALQVEKAIETALTIAKALAYAWEEHKMFHGDIKPENIIFTQNGEVKLADFGLAKRSGEIGAEDIMATPMYAPPEVIVGNKAKIGIRSDMYSFGVSLYEMLTGFPPFDEADPLRVLDLHLKEKHTPLAEKLIYIYPALSDLIDRLLDKNPDERPESWREIIAALQQVGKEPTPPPVPPKPRISRTALLLLTPIVAVFCIVVGFVLWGILSFGKLTYHAETSSVMKSVPLKLPDTRIPASPDNENSPPSSASQAKPAMPVQLDAEIIRLRQVYQEASEKFADATKRNIAITDISQMRQNLRQLLESRHRAESADALSEKQLEHVNKMIQQIERQIEQGRQKRSASRIAELKTIVPRERQEAAEKRQKMSASEFDPETVAGYFRILDAFFKLPVELRTRTGLIRAMSGVSMEQLLPALREKISFIENRLPARSGIFETFMDTPEKFEGLPLPWTIGGLSYETLGVDTEEIRLMTRLSEGAYSRRRLDWQNLSMEQQKLLLTDWLGNKRLAATPRQLSEVAAAIFARAEYPLPPEIAHLLTAEEQRRWPELKTDIADVATELAAAADFAGYHRASAANDHRKLASFIKEFRQKHRNTLVGRLAEEQFILPEQWIKLFLPQVIAEAALADLEQSNTSIASAMNAVAAVCRYAYLNQVDTATRTALLKQQNRFLQEAGTTRQAPQLHGEFGSWQQTPPGDIWSSGRPQTARALQMNPLPYCPALLDIGDWRGLYDIIATPDSRLWPEKAGVARFQPEYPALLYALGIVAVRKDRERLQKTIAELRDYAQRRNETEVLALAADLALQERDAQKALTLLANVKFSGKPTMAELAAVYCRLHAVLLTPALDETDYRRQVDFALQQLKPLDGENGHDLSPLRLSAQLVNGEDIHIERTTLQGANSYPGALLLADAGARNILLERDNIKHDQLCQLLQPQTNASAFRSELAWRLFLLQLTAAPLTPSRLLQQAGNELKKRQPATTPFYPELIMLKVAGAILNGDITPEQAPIIVAAFLDQGEVFPGKGCNYAANINPARFLRIAGTDATTKRELLPLGMLALSSARPAERAEILRTLHEHDAMLIWPERLLLQRFTELMSILGNQ